MATRVVGDVAVRIGADVGPLGIGLQEAGRKMDRFGSRSKRSMAVLVKNLKAVSLAGAAALGAITAGSRQAITALDNIGKTSSKLGITAEELQKLRFAAERAGVEARTLDMAVQRFTRRAAEAAEGTGEAKKALAEMGIQLKDANGNLRSTTDLLGDVADALQKNGSQADRVRLAFKLFDSEGVSMVNMLQEGKQAFLENTAAAETFGAVVSNETVSAAEDLQNQLGDLAAGIKGQLNAALIEAGPILISLAEGTLALAKTFNGLVTTIGDVYSAFESLISPQRRLENAHDEVVAAMADEIRQSQRLSAVLEQGGIMSEQTARLKLQEARARYENAQAAIEEARAIANNSDEMRQLNDRLKGTQAERRALVGTGDDGLIPFRMREQVEALDGAMVDIIRRQQQLRQIPEELQEQFERTSGNVERLTEALAGAKDGIVALGEVVEPITPREDTEDDAGGGGGGGKPEGRDTSELERLLGIDPESMDRTGMRMETALEKQQEFYTRAQEALLAAREAGLLTQEQYNRLEEQVENEHRAKMTALRRQQLGEALNATSEMFEGLAQLSQSGGERLLRIAKVFSAAQAFISTMQGAAEALKLPFPMNLAAAAKVIGTGAGFVAAIKGATAGGANDPTAAGGGGGGQTVESNPEDTASRIIRDINVTLRGGLAGQASGIRDIIRGINEELDDNTNLNVSISR